MLSLLLGTYLAQKLPFGRPAQSGKGRTVLAACMVGLPLLFVLGTGLFLPAYHSRFSLRDLVRRHQETGQRPDTRLACYPRLWDSIPFYLGRNDVRVYSSADKARLWADLKQGKETLLFVKAAHLAELQASWPPGLQGTIDAAPGQRLAVIVVRPQPS